MADEDAAGGPEQDAAVAPESESVAVVRREALSVDEESSLPPPTEIKSTPFAPQVALPVFGDGVVPKPPKDWTAAGCTHLLSLDRLEPRPHPTRRGATYFSVECPWCRSQFTLDTILTDHFTRLIDRIYELELEMEHLRGAGYLE